MEDNNILQIASIIDNEFISFSLPHIESNDNQIDDNKPLSTYYYEAVLLLLDKKVCI